MHSPSEISARDPHKSFIANYAPIFARLDTVEKDLIIQKSKVMEYKKGDSIYKQNDAPDAFYCVISGRVRIFTTYDRKEDTLEYLNCGKYFGMISLLTGEPHSVNAQAANDSRILKIAKEEFQIILDKIPRLAIDLSRILSRRLRRKDIHEKKIFESNILSVFSVAKEISPVTYAVNLGLSLRKETGKNIILINISKNTNEVYQVLGLAPEHTGKNNSFPSIKLVTPFTTDDAITCAIMKTGVLGISILNIYPDNASTDYASNLNALLTYLTGDYHYVIVSLSSPKDEVVFPALRQSDIIHIITDYETGNLADTRGLVVSLFKEVNYPQEKIKVIVSKEEESRHFSYEEAVKFLDYQIYANLPVVRKTEEKISGKIVLDEPDTEYAKTVRRIARELGDVRVGLALSGGAALGLAHIGVIKVLEKENIPIDIVVGSSMGAFIGALWVAGLSVEQIEKIALQFNQNKKKVFRLLLDPCFPKLSFFKGNRIRAILEKHIGNKTFQEVRCPFKVVACNLSKRQEFIFDSGRIVDAVMASIAIPGVFNPVRIDGNLLVDGGIIESVPIGVLVRSGIKKIIAVNVLPSPESIVQNYEINLKRLDEEKKLAWERGFFSRLSYNLHKHFKGLIFPNILDIIVNSIQVMEYIISKNDCQKADIVISPEIAGVDWFGFFEAEALIRKGEEEANKSLVAIKSLISE